MVHKDFSVLTVSKRNGWEANAAVSIANQTIHPKKWVVIRENNLAVSSLSKLYSPLHLTKTDIIAKEAPPKIRLSNLNASLNAGLKLIKTKYVIFYQDFIELPPDCFEKLLNLVDERTFVTTCTPNYDGSDDGRYTGKDKPRPCRPEEWEANVSIAPMDVIRALGGFDEDYDNGWSWDNVNLAQRAAMLGCKFILDESNRPKLYPHEQTDKETLPLNMERHARTMKAIREGRKPLQLPYL